MPPKIIFVGGAQATGKSSTLEKLIRRLERKVPGQVEYIEAGTVLRKAAQDTFGKHVNALTMDELEQIRAKFYRDIKGSNARVVLLVDHYAYAPVTEDEHIELPRASKELTKNLLPHIAHFVLFEASPEEVHRRRATEEKQRAMEYLHVKRGLLSQRLVARLFAEETNKPLEIVRNEAGKQRNAMRHIETIVRRHLER